MKVLFFVLLTLTCHAETRPNILFCIADDWGWPHASIYWNDPVVQTPAFDRVAREGALFNNAYAAAPSCTPSRNAIMTGKWHWQLSAGVNLYGTLPQSVETYVRLLQQSEHGRISIPFLSGSSLSLHSQLRTRPMAEWLTQLATSRLQGHLVW